MMSGKMMSTTQECYHFLMSGTMICPHSNSYTLEEDSDVEYRKNEYRVCGLGVEIMSPFRRKRIKFRGYLTKNDNELVYVKFRFLWYS
ncbi:unnamed protein product, partial [Oppiella nova]